MAHIARRGVIRGEKHIYSFEDLYFGPGGRITPTDVDALCDFSKKFFVVVEAKGEGVPFSGGQAQCLKNLLEVIDIKKAHSLFILVEHNEETEKNEMGHINANKAKIVRVEYRGVDGVTNELRGETLRDTILLYVRVSGTVFPQLKRITDY